MIGPTRSRSLHFFSQINPMKTRKEEVLVVSVSMHIFELFGNQGGHLVPVKIVWSVLDCYNVRTARKRCLRYQHKCGFDVKFVHSVNLVSG